MVALYCIGGALVIMSLLTIVALVDMVRRGQQRDRRFGVLMLCNAGLIGGLQLAWYNAAAIISPSPYDSTSLAVHGALLALGVILVSGSLAYAIRAEIFRRREMKAVQQHQPDQLAH